MAGIYSDILTQLAARIAYHDGTGELLDGLKWSDIPEHDVKGHDDMPALSVFPPSIDERVLPRMPYQTTVTIRLKLTCWRKDGVPSCLEWIEKILDSLDTTHDTFDNKDLRLNNTLRGPFSVKINPEPPTETTLAYQIVLTCRPMKQLIRTGRVG